MVDQRDLYEVLGLGRECTDEELKSAFRRLALKDHPDTNPGDSQAGERFKAINYAYQVLIDPKRRRAYNIRNPNAGRTSQPAPRSREWPVLDDQPFSTEKPVKRQSVNLKPESSLSIWAKSIVAILAVLGLAVAVSYVIFELGADALAQEQVFKTTPTQSQSSNSDRETLSYLLIFVVGCFAAYLVHRVVESALDRLHEDR